MLSDEQALDLGRRMVAACYELDAADDPHVAGPLSFAIEPLIARYPSVRGGLDWPSSNAWSV